MDYGDFISYYYGDLFSRYPVKIDQVGPGMGAVSGGERCMEFSYMGCPADTVFGYYVVQSNSLYCEESLPSFEDESCPVNNPTLPGSGVKIHREDLIAASGISSLPISLSYRSRYSGITSLANGGWIHNYQASIQHQIGTNAYIVRPNGAVYHFERYNASSPWTSIETDDELTQTTSGWQLKLADSDAIETYNASGSLVSILQRNGLKTTLNYNEQNQLVQVAHPFGRTLKFGYDAAGLLTRIDTSDVQRFLFAYDVSGNLSSITYPDGRSRLFHYENKLYKSALTGVTDESGQRIGTYSYHADGRVYETQRASGVDRTQFVYADDVQSAPQTQIKQFNAQGIAEQQTYNFVIKGHVLRPASISSSSGQNGSTQQTVYDEHGRKIREVNKDGRVTFYTRNAQGRVTEKATYPASYQSATTAPPLDAASGVTQTQWHPHLEPAAQNSGSLPHHELQLRQQRQPAGADRNPDPGCHGRTR
ncbi:MAG: hypothetical protein AB1766_02650, partial [Pseudomonadota bacterium]